MRREEQLKFCKTCANQKLDIKNGIICNLTNAPANFLTTCNEYVEDLQLKTSYEFEQIQKSVTKKAASKNKRFANYIIDIIIFYIFCMIIGGALGILIALINPEWLSVFDNDNAILEYLFGFICGMIYYTALEATTGRTIGKYITKTKLVDEHGNKPNLKTVLLRSLCRHIPFDAFSFLGSDETGWHDTLSKTRVVNV